MLVAAVPPSSRTASAVFDKVMPGGMLTVTVNALALADGSGSAPPPTLVARVATSKPLAPVPSGPSATLRVLPAAESAVVSSSVATCTTSVACPVNVTVGVAVVSSSRSALVFRVAPDFSASVQSASATLLPPMASGTSITSPAPSRRPRVTVNSTFSSVSPAVTAPSPTRASDTTVASLSAMVKSRLGAAPRTHVPGSAPSAIRSVSPGSSTVSLTTLKVALPEVAPCVTVSVPSV